MEVGAGVSVGAAVGVDNGEVEDVGVASGEVEDVGLGLGTAVGEGVGEGVGMSCGGVGEGVDTDCVGAGVGVGVGITAPKWAAVTAMGEVSSVGQVVVSPFHSPSSHGASTR